MFKNKAPKPPDYRPIIAAQERMAKQSELFAKEQFEWAKGAYEKDSKVTSAVSESMLASMKQQKEWATKDRKRYEDVYQPIENELIKEAKDYASPQKMNEEVGRATGAVSQQFEQARQNSQRMLESYGLNPSSTRYAALDIGVRTAQAASQAAAGEEARRATEATRRNLQAQAIDIGRGMPAQALSAAAGGNNAGTGAASVANNATQVGASTMGTAQGYMGQQQQALGSWANTLNMGYQNRMSHNQASQQLSPVGQLLGMAGGMAMKGFGFSEGGPVPAEMSPSRGAIPDDVPANVSAGEFVIPEEAVRWYGEKHFHGLVDKAKQAKTAIPAPA